MNSRSLSTSIPVFTTGSEADMETAANNDMNIANNFFMVKGLKIQDLSGKEDVFRICDKEDIRTVHFHGLHILLRTK